LISNEAIARTNRSSHDRLSCSYRPCNRATWTNARLFAFLAIIAPRACGINPAAFASRPRSCGRYVRR
jgi:hypothetical protein